MRPEPTRSITKMLIRAKAKTDDIWEDGFGNRWRVKTDRDGYSLEGIGMLESNAWVPYWTCFVIELPDFRPTGKRVTRSRT